MSSLWDDVKHNSITGKIHEEYRKIGEISYTLYTDGSFEIEKIAGMFETIKNYYQTLDEMKVKLNEILSRYDEELAILRPTPRVGQENCPNCQKCLTNSSKMMPKKCIKFLKKNLLTRSDLSLFPKEEFEKVIDFTATVANMRGSRLSAWCL